MTRGSAVKGLREVALRVNNLERMKRFCQEVLGFEVLGEFPSAALLKIAAGYAGHTQVLGLFDRSASVDQERTTIDHITFTIGPLDYDSERKRLETLGLNVEVHAHEWIDWRSLYFQDPEGNRGRTGLLRRKSERIKNLVIGQDFQFFAPSSSSMANVRKLPQDRPSVRRLDPRN